MYAGSGTDLFDVQPAQSDLIVGFNTAKDFLQLNDPNPDVVLANAQVGNSGTTLSLSDGTRVVLYGVNNLTSANLVG